MELTLQKRTLKSDSSEKYKYYQFQNICPLFSEKLKGILYYLKPPIYYYYDSQKLVYCEKGKEEICIKTELNTEYDKINLKFTDSKKLFISTHYSKYKIFDLEKNVLTGLENLDGSLIHIGKKIYYTDNEKLFFENCNKIYCYDINLQELNIIFDNEGGEIYSFSPSKNGEKLYYEIYNMDYDCIQIIVIKLENKKTIYRYSYNCKMKCFFSDDGKKICICHDKVIKIKDFSEINKSYDFTFDIQLDDLINVQFYPGSGKVLFNLNFYQEYMKPQESKKIIILDYLKKSATKYVLQSQTGCLLDSIYINVKIYWPNYSEIYLFYGDAYYFFKNIFEWTDRTNYLFKKEIRERVFHLMCVKERLDFFFDHQDDRMIETEKTEEVLPKLPMAIWLNIFKFLF